MSRQAPPPHPDVLLATVVRFLLEGNEEQAAQVLMACRLDLEITESPDRYPLADAQARWAGGNTHLEVTFTGDRRIYDMIEDPLEAPLGSVGFQIKGAFRAAFKDWGSVGFGARIEQVQIPEEWREKLLAIARGEHVSNQGTTIDVDRPLATWKGLKFRSRSEVRIAEALDRANVMFFPNCKGRLGLIQDDRYAREPDFLVCHKGRWGVLEVDGEPFHPPSRTTEDHARDRLFRQHGIKVVEHFDATECYQDPDDVVRRFLVLLEQV